MSLIPYAYNDIGLTDQIDDASDTLGAQAVNGASGDGVFYIGTPTSGNRLQDAASPGSADITVSIVDADANVDAADIKLALTSAGLDSATGGASLALGTQIVYGSPVAVHYRWANDAGGSTYTGMSLQRSAVIESAIP